MEWLCLIYFVSGVWFGFIIRGSMCKEKLGKPNSWKIEITPGNGCAILEKYKFDAEGNKHLLLRKFVSDVIMEERERKRS